MRPLRLPNLLVRDFAVPAEHSPLFCDRCGAELHPGTGDSFSISVEAVADPAPPSLGDQPGGDLRGQIQALLAGMERLSEREALDTVHRRLTLFLCVGCFRVWIEDPTA